MLQKSSIDGVQFPYHKIKFQLYAPKRQWGPVGVREMRQSPLFSGGCIGVYTSGKEGARARVRDSVGLLGALDFTLPDGLAQATLLLLPSAKQSLLPVVVRSIGAAMAYQ